MFVELWFCRQELCGGGNRLSDFVDITVGASNVPAGPNSSAIDLFGVESHIFKLSGTCYFYDMNSAGLKAPRGDNSE